MSSLKTWILASRPKTLPAAAAPVVIAAALAWSEGVFHGLSAFAALIAAFLIQIGTNFTNDYADFLKGADTDDRKGPTRVTQAGLLSPASVRTGAIVVFLTAFLVGMYLVSRAGWPILMVGVVSIVCGIWYTVGRYSLAYTGLADLFVLVFFGPVAVGGTYFVQALALPWWVVVAGFGPGLLSVAILTVNNRRDIDEDRAAGKKTLVVRWGRTFGNNLYVSTLLLASLVPVLLYIVLGSHGWAVISAAILIPGWSVVRILLNEDGKALNPMLGATARLLMLYSILFSVGWVIQ